MADSLNCFEYLRIKTPKVDGCPTFGAQLNSGALKVVLALWERG